MQESCLIANHTSLSYLYLFIHVYSFEFASYPNIFKYFRGHCSLG